MNVDSSSNTAPPTSPVPTTAVLIAEWTAPWLFSLALLFLVCQAILIVMWVDVPSLADPTDVSAAVGNSGTAGTLVRITLTAMALIWPVVWLESLYHWTTRPKTKSMRPFHFYTALFCLCPSLRMCARSVEKDYRLWLPGLGWQRANKRLHRRLSRWFSVPMIGIALLILPVLLIEFTLKDQVAKYAWLRFALHVSTGVIWLAFAAEFILMVSIAPRKWTYLKEHWVDLAIIALPIFSFLRTLRLVKATKLMKFGKLPQLVRAYRLRGTALRGFRAFVVLDVVQRFVRTDPEREIARLTTQLQTHQREARLIRLAIVRLQRQLDEQDQSDDADDIDEVDKR